MAKSEEQKQAEEAEKQRAAADEAAAVERQMAEIAAAEERRDFAAVRRMNARKSYPDDAEPPTQVTKKNETAYSVERLIEQSEAFLGQPRHVLAGALAAETEPYLTLDEARDRIDGFLNTEITVGGEV